MRSLETPLRDRTLRFDGVSIVSPDEVSRLLMRGLHPSQIRVTEMSEDVIAFNEQVVEGDRLHLTTNEPIPIRMEWQLPVEYKEMNLNQFVVEAFMSRQDLLSKYSPEVLEKAANRIDVELQEITKRGMVEFVKTIIYILDVLREQNLIWGVGRGSSCASYILFVLGLHVVDCVLFDVSMDEFFHD